VTPAITWQGTIRDWLDQQERSQSWLARKAVMDTSYLSAILNGLRHPGPKVLGRLDKAMGLPVGTLEVQRAQAAMEVAANDNPV